MTTALAARLAAPILCASALATTAGCTGAAPPPSTVEPGSKATAAAPPKNLPAGVKVGKGKSEVQ